MKELIASHKGNYSTIKGNKKTYKYQKVKHLFSLSYVVNCLTITLVTLVVNKILKLSQGAL